MAPRPTPFTTERSIAVWLFICALVTFAMVILGGVTRLTHSGLSMVDWQPIMGIVPPLTDTQWMTTFEAYKQFPEYQKVNHGMDLPGFKQIFWFEYSHRVLGRGIGLLFALPFALFLIRRQLNKPLTWKLLGIFTLGGLQGLMGWYMVKSGLVDNPMVSQYRLTAHLGLAVLIFGAILWVAWDIWYDKRDVRYDKVFFLAPIMVCLVLVSGGIVAGTRAGLLFGTWPLMGETFLPAGLYANGWFHSVFEDPITIQFNHRMLAYAAVLILGWLGFSRLKNDLNAEAHPAIYAMFALLAIQVGLGISTLVLRVPVPLAASHQAVALLLVGASLFCCHRLGTRS